MRFQDLPGVKMLNGLLWTVILVGVAWWVVIGAIGISLTGESVVEERTTLAILRSEALTFLVTRRAVTQIVVEHQESNWLGQWRGVLWATVNVHYGVDLAKIQARDIRRDGNVILVKLPEPEVLDFSIEPGSIGILSKSTAVPKIEDLLNNGHRRVLEGRLRQAALDFAQQRDMFPTRNELIEQLNEAASLLTSDALRLRFE